MSTPEPESPARTDVEPAVPDAGSSGTAELTSNAPARTRAREERLTAGKAWVAREFTLPVVWTDPLPPVSASYRYATKGGQAPVDGAARKLAVGYAYLSIGPLFVLAWLYWIVKRPSRLVVALLLYSLIAHIGPGTALWFPYR